MCPDIHACVRVCGRDGRADESIVIMLGGDEILLRAKNNLLLFIYIRKYDARVCVCVCTCACELVIDGDNWYNIQNIHAHIPDRMLQRKLRTQAETDF